MLVVFKKENCYNKPRFLFLISDFVAQICELLLDFIIDSNLPFRIVQSKTLQELLCRVACREVVLPSIPKTMAALDLRFKGMKSQLINELRKQKHVCLTADIWTHMRKSYLGVSVHYIDSNWQRKSYILAFRYMNKRHTYDYLAQVLSSILAEYDLAIDKVSHIVTDGGSNFCKAFKVYGRNNDFSCTLYAIEEDQDEENIEDNDDLPDATVQLLEANNANVDILEVEAAAVIRESNIQGIQIDLPNDPDDINNDIVLPPQMRCFAHLLNLIGKYLLKQQISCKKA